MLLALCFALFNAELSHAVIRHIEMTPDIAGSDAVVMKRIDQRRTTFTIRTSAEKPENLDPIFAFVRRGILSVYSENGRIMNCEIAPKRNDNELLYVFELDNDLAKSSRFELAEFEDNGQVGGGSISSYQLFDFIDQLQT
jgi:hypothetical protein